MMGGMRSVVAAVAVAVALVALPVGALDVLGGGRRGRGRRGRIRIRVGPGFPARLVLALRRRADAVALTAVQIARLSLIVVYARAYAQSTPSRWAAAFAIAGSRPG